MQDLATLADAVREVCPKGLWSQGIKLARENAVSVEEKNDQEMVLRVKTPGMAIAPTVVLHLQDNEWECDCPGTFDACAHVAASVIAANSGALQSKSLPEAQIVYRFTEHPQGVLLAREKRTESGFSPLTDSLLGATAKRQDLQVIPNRVDLELERKLGNRFPTVVTLVNAPEVFSLLSSEPRVYWNSTEMKTGAYSLMPQGLVIDTEQGIRLTVSAHSRLSEVLAPGIARLGNTMHVLGHAELTGLRLEKLPLVRNYKPSEFAELVTKVIPDLEVDIPVTILSSKLPKTARNIPPRIHFEWTHSEGNVAVLPTLVYGDPPTARVDGDKLVQLRSPAPVRDRGKERMLKFGLRDELNMSPGHAVIVTAADSKSMLEKISAWQTGSKTASLESILLPGELVPSAKFHEAGAGSTFDVDFTIEVQGRTEKVAGLDVVRAWQKGLELVPLLHGGWAELPEDWLKKHGRQLADLLAARDAKGQAPDIAYISAKPLFEALDLPIPNRTKLLEPLLENFAGLPEFQPPKGFTATLRDYQHIGVRWLGFLRKAGLGGILADDMGLGKTVQTIAVLASPTLIVAPTSMVFTWEKELARFWPELSINLYHGSGRKRNSADVTITSYALLRQEIAEWSQQKWQTVILDEAQAIKNPDSQVAHAAHNLQANFRVALSGTPIENRLEELWSLMQFANPGLLGDRRGFIERYGNAASSGESEEGKVALHALRDKVKPVMLRRTKREVLPDLPPRTDAILYSELSAEERAIYESVLAASREQIIGQLAEGASVMQILEALLRLRQAACHGSLVPGQQLESSTKLETLIDKLTELAERGHRAIVFSQWTSLLDLIEPLLNHDSINFIRLDGATRDRRTVVEKFQDPNGPTVLLSSLKAGGTGLTLTSADHVFLVDPWWNPAAEEQAAGRAHRIGQEKPVMVYRMIAKNTIEERILVLQEQKRKLAEAMFGGESVGANLSREDLLALLA